jgi:uncharacterized protein YjbJ (UPF0337 family)
MWNKNERDGKSEQVKGTIKKAVGDLTGDDTLKTEGGVEGAIGKAKIAVGQAQRKVGAAVEHLRKAAKS